MKCILSVSGNFIIFSPSIFCLFHLALVIKGGLDLQTLKHSQMAKLERLVAVKNTM
jgi:hypothetical protein